MHRKRLVHISQKIYDITTLYKRRFTAVAKWKYLKPVALTMNFELVEQFTKR